MKFISIISIPLLLLNGCLNVQTITPNENLPDLELGSTCVFTVTPDNKLLGLQCRAMNWTTREYIGEPFAPDLNEGDIWACMPDADFENILRDGIKRGSIRE